MYHTHFVSIYVAAFADHMILLCHCIGGEVINHISVRITNMKQENSHNIRDKVKNKENAATQVIFKHLQTLDIPVPSSLKTLFLLDIWKCIDQQEGKRC